MEEIDRWSDIGQDLLEEISKRFFSYNEYIQLRLVCKEWSLKLAKIPRVSKTPWLLLPEETFKNHCYEDEEIYQLMQLPLADDETLDTDALEEEEIHRMMLPDMQKHNILIRGSCHGCLIIMGRNTRFGIFVTKLLGGTLDSHSMHRIQLWKVIINSSPDYDDENFMAVAIFRPCNRLAFYKPGNSRWTEFPTKDEDFEDVIFFEEKIYAINNDDQIYEFETKGRAGLIRGGIHESRPPADELPLGPYYPKHLIGCGNGSLLMLVRHVSRTLGMRRTKEHETSKFDIYELKRNRKEWSKLDNLGNHILLVGFNSSAQIPAPFLSKGNQIWFTDILLEVKSSFEHVVAQDIGIFDLDEGSFKRVLLDV
ncbi:hypothetical protein PIB30_069938 [Stylosanthes scabra]|uniref:KIB1-4 beta-propeller domain-containing protein n=1 Tax=Stylosanthes scabra TaxID=79078 RepID=A0ABU6VLQ5_9FABA|nr:hypothetical protein [Stylosanthes scabra]